MRALKASKVNVKPQREQIETSLPPRNAADNANENENEIENEGTNRSTDTTECYGNRQTATTTEILTLPLSAAVPEELNGTVKTADVVAISNEETEIVAMVSADAAKMSAAPPSNTKLKANTLVITTNETEEITRINQSLGEFAVPAIPAAKATGTNGTNGTGGSGVIGTSTKKKRYKSAKRREENETRHNGGIKIGRGGSNGTRSIGTVATAGVANDAASVVAASMKTSISMTSLPPDDEKAESRDVIKAKLRVERPYNSLKKNIERNVGSSKFGVKPYSFSQSNSSSSSFANHRYSWGSGYSYSSSSLQSSTTLGLGSAKDDLWAAIQTNYNYIMDTNLLDSCKEAERHLAEPTGNADVDCEQSQCCLKLLGVTQRRDMLWQDPAELRKWLRDMEGRLEGAPSVSAATALSIAELQRCLAEHSVLYHEIVSHARVVSACIRAASEEQQGHALLQQQQQQEEQQLESLDSCSTTVGEEANSALAPKKEKTSLTQIQVEKVSEDLSSNSSSSGIETAEKSSISSKKSSTLSSTSTSAVSLSLVRRPSQETANCTLVEDSLDRLQNRYHLLYLKAFEVQLWLDGLLRKKFSTATIVDGADYVGNDGDDDSDVECNSSECEGNDAAATENDLNVTGSGIESDITHNSSSIQLQNCRIHKTAKLIEEGNRESAKVYCEDGDDEGEEEEDEDEVDFGRARLSWPTRACSATITLTDFEADSESSDWEVTQQRLRPQRQTYNANFGSKQATEKEAIPNTSNIVVESVVGDPNASNDINLIQSEIYTSTVACSSFHPPNASNGLITYEERESAAVATLPILMKTKMNNIPADCEQQKCGELLPLLVSMSPATSTSTSTSTVALTTNTTSTATQTQAQQKLQSLHNSQHVDAAIKQKSVAVISPNSHHNKSPTVLRKRQQQHHIDISKFNRSNRKSKNCAIFYFKHLDTDNETNCSSVGDAADLTAQPDGLSSSTSQTSEHHLLKSADASSDDDGSWMYSSTLPPQRNEMNGEGGFANDVDKGSNCITTIVIDGLQSSAVSSSTAAATTTEALAVISDDSDKENKKVHATKLVTATLTTPTAAAISSHTNNNTLPSTSLLSVASAVPAQNHTHVAYAEIQFTPVLTTTIQQATGATVAVDRFVASTSGSSGSSSYSTRSSSCSSNELLTETTSATNTTQITQMHFQRNHRTEMALQINGNCDKSKQITVSDVAVTNFNNDNGGSNNNNDNTTGSNNQYAEMKTLDQQRQYCEKFDILNGNLQKNELRGYAGANSSNVATSANKTQIQQQILQPMETRRGLLLPPRSPTKSAKAQQSSSRSDNVNAINVTKGKLSHESIKQLVLEAEHLVRDAEASKTPNKQKQKHSVIKLSSTVKKREVTMPGPIKQRVQEWLEHQPSTPNQLHRNPPQELLSIANVNAKAAMARTDDCEASGEASETDSVPQQGSDTSEGFTDSIATCMQTSTNSYGDNSTECFGGSAEPILSPTTVLGYGSSNQSLNMKVVKRSQARRKSERPWSVSCLSQLTTETVQTSTAVTAVSNVQTGLATHSISESALDSLSPGRQRASSSSTTNVVEAKTCNSKGSLKRRKTRKKKASTGASVGIVVANTLSAGKKTPDTGTADTSDVPRLAQTLLMKSCESMTAHQIREITSALLCLQRNNTTMSTDSAICGSNGVAQHPLVQTKLQQHHNDSSEDAPLMKPNFRVGSYTTAYMRNEKRLGSLAALATYMNDEEERQQGEYTTGTEDHHSSFSETAWDNYQEKYNSENYSEGFDSDAARRLMEFGDDYRNFIDSQSDCCSSLSAANNVDSLSPPRMDSLQQNEAKVITQDTIANSVDHARRRRALDLEYERRRKTLEVRRKSCQDSTDTQNAHSPDVSQSSSTNVITPKIGIEKFNKHKSDSTSRKLEFGLSHSVQSLRRTSESDTSIRRRKVDERRRSTRNLDKCIRVIPATSSSSCDDSDDEKEMRNLLQQSQNRLEDTEALKIRCHLLRPEDYMEIISTCRDNIRCLEAVLRGPPGTVLSAQCAGQTKDLLAAWEDLLGWSENAAAARKMQEEMVTLKQSLSRFGNKATCELLNTEPQIQIAIETLKNEKTELQNYRTNMLRLNAGVHSWLTRQERHLQRALGEPVIMEPTEEQIQLMTDESELGGDGDEISIAVAVDSPANAVIGVAATTALAPTTTAGKSLKVPDQHTLINSENEFHIHLKNEVADMYSAWDDADARINTQLETLTTSLIAWRQLENGLYEFQQALGQDRGTLKGLEGALNKGQTTPVELAQNVKVVAKLLSERVHVSQEQLTAVQEHLDPNHILNIAKFTASNGSLSDSGISDGGATSDGGLSERERRLGVLRRLVKQLELALAPGSEAMKSIAMRMESAEAELKTLQNTCRDLIVRTAATHQNKKIQQQLQQSEAQQLRVLGDEAIKLVKMSQNVIANGQSGGKKVSPAHGEGTSHKQNLAPQEGGRHKQRKRSIGSNTGADNNGAFVNNGNYSVPGNQAVCSYAATGAPDSGDPADDPDLEFDLDTSDDKAQKISRNSWAWRIAKAAVPMQIALITFLCAACLMQPNCCDNLNNLSMSFTPQLRYIRGPPPI